MADLTGKTCTKRVRVPENTPGAEARMAQFRGGEVGVKWLKVCGEPAVNEWVADGHVSFQCAKHVADYWKAMGCFREAAAKDGQSA